MNLCERGHRVGLDLEHVADFAFGILKTAAGPLHALLGAGGGFTRARQRLQRDFRGAIGFRHHGFGGGERIGRIAAILFRMLDLADDGAALLREQGGRVVEVGALSLHLGDARLDGRDLRGCALLAGLPLVTLGDDRLHAAICEFGFARQRLGFGANLRGEPAMTIDLGPDFAEFRFGFEARRQLAKCHSRGFVSSGCLGAVVTEAALRFGEG